MQDRDVVAVAGGVILGAKRVRQDGQPLAQQGVDLLGSEPIADRERRGVLDRGEPVVQRLERDAGLGGLALRPVVAVDAQLGVIRKVQELKEERAEIFVVAIEIEVVDHPSGGHYRRVGIAIGVAAALGAKQLGFSCARPMNNTPSSAVKPAKVLVHDIVLALALRKVDPRNTVRAGESVHRGAERVGDLRQRRGRGDRQPQPPLQVADRRRHTAVAEHRRSVHPVHAVHLEDHMVGQDIADGSRYHHLWAPIETGGRQATNRAMRFHTPDRAFRSRSHPTRPEPPSRRDQRHASLGSGEAPVDLESEFGTRRYARWCVP